MHIKKFWKQYGWLGLGIYFGIWGMGIPSFWLFFEYGFVGFSSVEHLLAYYDPSIDISRFSGTYGNLLLAVAVNELIEPIRIPVAIATTVFIRRVLNRRKTAQQNEVKQQNEPPGTNQKLEDIGEKKEQ